MGKRVTDERDRPIGVWMRWATSVRGPVTVAALACAAGASLLAPAAGQAESRQAGAVGRDGVESHAAAARAAGDGASELLNRAFADARARGSFHQTVIQDYGSRTGVLVNDVALRSGRQTISSTDGTRAKIVVSGGTAYVSGNQYALSSYFKFTPGEVASIGGDWVAIPSTDSGFASVAYDVTVPTALTAVAPSGHLREGARTTLDGQEVTPITGGIPAIYNGSGRTTIYITASGDPLPIRATIQVSKPPYPSISVTGTMGRWGERVAVTPPRGVLSTTQIRALAGRLEHLSIPGATGYFTFSGPGNLPATVGRPWGRACEPIAFVIGSRLPISVRRQVLQVIAAARDQGLDVTATVGGRLLGAGLFYRDGQSARTTAKVPILAGTGNPPALPDGRSQQITIATTMRADRSGQGDDLTGVTGTLQLRALNGQPDAIQRAIRQLIAWTQGIGRTGNAVSGIANAATPDRFTAADVAAMLKMSGCAKPVINGIAA